MKLNITVDLQDIFDCQNEEAYHDGQRDGQGGGGYNLSESIKNEIIGAILGKVSKECISVVMKKANTQVEQALTQAISSAVDAIKQRSLDYAENWLKGENVVITDKWGDKKEKTSIKALIHATYENTLNQSVDDSGKFTSGSYGRNKKLVEYICEKNIKKCIEEKLPAMDRTLDKLISEVIQTHSKKLITDKLSKILDSK